MRERGAVLSKLRRACVWGTKRYDGCARNESIRCGAHKKMSYLRTHIQTSQVCYLWPAKLLTNKKNVLYLFQSWWTKEGKLDTSHLDSYVLDTLKNEYVSQKLEATNYLVKSLSTIAPSHDGFFYNFTTDMLTDFCRLSSRHCRTSKPIFVSFLAVKIQWNEAI